MSDRTVDRGALLKLKRDVLALVQDYCSRTGFDLDGHIEARWVKLEQMTKTELQLYPNADGIVRVGVTLNAGHNV